MLLLAVVLIGAWRDEGYAAAAGAAEAEDGTLVLRGSGKPSRPIALARRLEKPEGAGAAAVPDAAPGAEEPPT